MSFLIVWLFYLTVKKYIYEGFISYKKVNKINQSLIYLIFLITFQKWFEQKHSRLEIETVLDNLNLESINFLKKTIGKF